MHLASLATAVPESSFTQPECWEILRRNKILDRLSTRSGSLLEKVLLGNGGIERRHFSTSEPAELFRHDAEGLNRLFEKAAPTLAGKALTSALQKADMEPSGLDALFVCTCTGYLCPGVSSYVAEALGLRDDAFLQDLVGLGCGAAIPTHRAAQGFLAANPGASVACVAVEICSAAFYLENDPGVLISACLFGDGAAATIWNDGEANSGLLCTNNFTTVHRPEQRELLRFTNAGGKLRNRLHKSVPEFAAKAVRTLYDRTGPAAEATMAAHTGGRDVLDALEREFPATDFSPSREVLRAHGNQSSPSVLFVLERILREGPPPERIWLTSFGAGFAAHACSLASAGSSALERSGEPVLS